MVSNAFLFFDKYHFDDLFVVIVVLIGAMVCKLLPVDFERQIFINSEIDWDLATDTIPYGILCICTFGIGSIVIVTLWAVVKFDSSIFSALYSYLLSVSLSALLCGILNRIIARPKPDTVAICGGDGSIKTCSGVLTKQLLIDQFSSFPSAHAAEAFASAVFISLSIGAAFNSSSMFTAIIELVPIVFALFVSASRVWDRQSHIEDVIAGILIGCMMAYICFQNFNKGRKMLKITKSASAMAESSAVTAPSYI